MCGVGRGGEGGEVLDLNRFYTHESSPLILIHLQITNMCSVHIGVIYLISETNFTVSTYNLQHYAETKQSVQQ